jgi:hypothetical protein
LNINNEDFWGLDKQKEYLINFNVATLKLKYLGKRTLKDDGEDLSEMSGAKKQKRW